MKRLLCLALSVVMLLTVVLPISAQAVTVNEYTLISKGASYTFTECYTTPGLGYTSVDGKELTDGKLPTDDYGTEWIALDYRLEAPISVVIDLGKNYDNLGKFRVYLTAQAHSGIDRPSECSFYVSADGKEFTKVGEGTYEDENAKYTWCTLELDGKIGGRYVKISMGEAPLSGVFVFCGEVEVYSIEGNDVPAASIPGIELADGTYIGLDGDYLTKLHSNHTVDYVMENLDSVTYVSAFSANGNKKNKDATLKTGDYFAKIIDNTEIDRLSVVIEGDINGDGKITLNDYIISKRIASKNATVSGAFLKANAGAERIKDHIIGEKSMFAEYPHHPVAPDVEVTEYTKHVMSLTKNSNVLYTMETTASNGKKLTLTFDKKSWGTWNIGTLKIDGLALAGGGTDWEYVFRAKNAKDGFSGGNHGNEVLVDIKFYDGVSGKELNLSNGQTVKNLEKIKIVENTTLNLGDASSTYAKVTRTYMLYGETITLDCDFEFITNMDFSLSYTCMFPVAKTVGLYCMFKNIDGTEKFIETLEVGLADYSGTMYKENPALECVIWGKKITDYAFVVQVDTKEDSVDNFKNKAQTFYWDMNQTHNKLYFSRFPDSGYETVKAGTEWHTSSAWTVVCLD